MHYISKIEIKNYKSIIDEKFLLTEYTALVGYNNAGKSNILEASKWLLNKSSLSKESFYNENEPIVVSADIKGITEILLDGLVANHRTSIEPYINEEVIRIRRIQNIPSDKAANIKINVWSEEEGIWKSNPTGLDNALKSLFPEAIEIGAMENSAEDASKSKSTTTIGKLIAEVMAPIEENHSTVITEALSELKNKFDADGTERAEELTEFDTQTSRNLQELFPGISIKLHVPTPEIKEVFKSGTLKIYENGEGRDLTSYGHGTQRSVQMALVQHLAEIKKGTQDRVTNTLLLIDEPELYLHPQAVEQVRSALKVLSKNGYQVLFTTHSPQMIPSEDVKNTLLIRKDMTRGTYARTSLLNAVQEVETEARSQFELLFSLEYANQILFSEKVLLAEGKTEKRLLPYIFERYCNKSLGQNKIAFTDLGGSGNVYNARKVLNVMNLPCKSIVDLDYAFKEAVNNGLIENTNIDFITLKNKFQTNTEISLSDDSLPKNSSNMKAADAYKWLAEQQDMQPHIESLHNILKTQDIWLWRKGVIEEHLDITAKNEQGWARFKRRLDEEEFNDVVVDTDVIAMLDWLNE